MSDVTTTTIDFIRHGEPLGGRRFRGQTDDPLSETGWQQMRAALGDHRPWQAVISSSLVRCADFARELAARHDLPLEIDARLRELGFGAWEGRAHADLETNEPVRLWRFRLNPVAHPPPGSEPLVAFRARILSAWNEIVQRHRGRHVLIVGHAGTVRMVVNHVLGGPLEHVFRLQVPCAGITRIQIDQASDGTVPRLVFHAGRL